MQLKQVAKIFKQPLIKVACPLLPGASGVSPLPREAWAMLHLLNVLSVSDDPIIKG